MVLGKKIKNELLKKGNKNHIARKVKSLVGVGV